MAKSQAEQKRIGKRTSHPNDPKYLFGLGRGHRRSGLGVRLRFLILVFVLIRHVDCPLPSRQQGHTSVRGSARTSGATGRRGLLPKRLFASRRLGPWRTAPIPAAWPPPGPCAPKAPIAVACLLHRQPGPPRIPSRGGGHRTLAARGGSGCWW